MTQAAEVQTEATVTVEESAIERIKWIREQEGLDESAKLRIAIVGGGCSGFKYAMGLTDEVMDDDQIIGDCVVIDETSLGIMNGSSVAYVDHMTGAQFVINNPNVESGCGCGSSFSVKDEE